MTEPAEQRRNPYVGPRAFRSGEKLYGRNTEIQKLYHLLMAERIVLLHAPSGAGKTSLVEAGLIPKFRRDGFHVWPSTNLKRHSSSALNNSDANIYALSILSSLEEAVDSSERLSIDELASLSLSEYLDRVSDPSLQADELLIFDQFEDIVRLDLDDRAGKMAFFEQIGDVLKARNRWALFAMREEYLGALEPYLRAIPSRLEYRFRLNLLDEDAAAEAIREPAKDENVTFAEGTIPKLVENLKGISDGVERHPYIEPVHLQVVCRSLWNKLTPSTSVFTAEMLGTLSDVDSALSEYYSTGVAEASTASGVDEGEIRDWFEARLMTADGVRRQTRVQPGAAEHSKAVVDTLEDVFLVRTEDRHGFRWMELAHDRLVEPILANNSEWRTKNLSAFQQKARLWDELGRPRDELLAGRELKGAHAWEAKRAQPLSDVEDAFLRRCNDEASVRRARRFWSGVAAAALVAFGLYFAYDEYEDLQTAEREQLERVIQSAAAEDLDPELSLLLLLEALTRGWAPETPLDDLSLENLFRNGLERFSPYRALYGHIGPVLDVLFSPITDRNELLISAGTDGLINVWDPDTGSQVQALLFHTSPVQALAVSPNGSLLASADADGVVTLWRLRPDGVGYEFWRTFVAHIDAANAVVFSSDGRRIVTAGDDGLVHVWESASGELVRSLPQQTRPVGAVAVDGPEGRLLATGDDRGIVRLWDTTTGRLEWEFSAGRSRVIDIGFSPDGRRIAASTWQEATRVWDVSSRRLNFENDDDGALASTFSIDGRRFATATQSNQIRIWDTQTWEEVGSIRGHVNRIQSLAFSRDSGLLASTDETAAVQVRSRTATSAIPSIPTDDNDVSWLEFVDDEDQFLTASQSGRIGAWRFSELGEPDALASPFELGRNPITLKDRRVSAFAASTDGRYVVLALGQEAAILTRDGSIESARFVEAQTNITSIAIDPGSDWLVAGDAFGALYKWSLVDENQAPVLLEGHTVAVADIAFTADSALLVSGDTNGVIRITQFDTGDPANSEDRLIGSLQSDAVDVLSIDRNGRWLLVGSQRGGRGLLNLWDLSELRNGQNQPPLRVAILDNSVITDVDFHPDGMSFVSSHSDGTLAVWDVESRSELHRYEHHASATSARFDPSGDFVVVARDDGTVHVYAFSVEKLVLQAANSVQRSLTESECLRFFEQACSPSNSRAYLQAAQAEFLAGNGVLARQFIDRAAEGDETVDVDAEIRRWALATAVGRARRLAEEADIEVGRIDLAGEEREILDFPFTLEGSALGSDVETAGNRFLVSVFVRRGTALVRENNLADAAEFFRAAAELKPDLGFDPKARMRVLVALEAARASEDSGGDLELLRSAIAADGANAEWIFLLGRGLYDRRHYLESSRAFEKAARLRPDRSEFHFWYAYSVLERIDAKQLRGLPVLDEEHQRAEAAALRAIDIHPNEGFAIEALARLALVRGQPADALEYLDAVLRQDQRYESALMLAGAIRFDYSETRDYETAYRIFLLLADRNPDSGSYLANLAEASLATGRFQEAFDLAGDLLANPDIYQDLQASIRSVMWFLQLAASLLQDRDDLSVSVLGELTAQYDEQPANWTFGGTRAFVCDYSMPQNEKNFLLWMMTILESGGPIGTAGDLEQYLRDGPPGVSNLAVSACGRG